jgi:hypothetical protein
MLFHLLCRERGTKEITYIVSNFLWDKAYYLVRACVILNVEQLLIEISSQNF